MQTIIIFALTVSYILAAYVGPVAAVAASVYWGYGFVAGGGTVIGGIFVALINALLFLIALALVKRVLKWLMNKIDLDDEVEAGGTD